MRELAALAVAGALGAVSRYWLSGWAYRALGEGFPHGTLLVNVTGCLFIGFMLHIGLTTEALTPTARLAVTVGFLGAFTTFSTFGYETFRLLETGAWGAAFTNVAANVLLGLAAVWLGLVAARGLFGGT